ncbi:hypothetical protein K435DRAFT_254291 [Dendrothele bispora CBS 962.96]|uniref:Uncharacterized protein n=1 Tax=Dendrothele bispora (strain CBS 962.96) TaxID=1314807 RepID=A0A4S8KJB3_DENBC|nr:hypothetical protein K435DRAFT_254291 [Dendrothele bispora CBS 962.96]
MSETVSSRSLPLLADSALQDAPETIQSAYNLIFEAQNAASSDEEAMSARVVGFLLIEFWRSRTLLGDEPALQITREAVSQDRQGSQSSPVIYELGRRYRENLIRAFRRAKGSLPMPSEHVSRLSFDSVESYLLQDLQASPQNYQTAKKHTLARDDFRCMLSGAFDKNAVKSIKEVHAKMKSANG